MPTYSVRHHTRYRYSATVTLSLMEARMQPRTDGGQTLHSFRLSVSPSVSVQSYTDHLGNLIHWFNVPRGHGNLVIQAESLVDVEQRETSDLKQKSVGWAELDRLGQQTSHWDWLAPSHFARSTESLQAFAQAEGIHRQSDPLTTLETINRHIFDAFDYVPASTMVDSPIDVALDSRRGVCQDYTHIFIALARSLGIPCRYVSGYLYHREDVLDRSAEDATHAWAEAYLPALGWIGFDPTNHLIAHGRHIRTAIGRDYADVPPTKGVFQGEASTELDVGVQVELADRPDPEEELIPTTGWTPPDDADELQQQQQQQQ